MSKAEYTLLATVIGFYILLFAYLVTRALVEMIRAWRPTPPKIKMVSRREASTARDRAWTRAVWRAPLAPVVAPEMERRDRAATSIA
ncbi:MAG TPA: hypothetical protein VF544_15575 [Pyrinomonadaceae bacterium]|jgi:hypothetical protein